MSPPSRDIPSRRDAPVQHPSEKDPWENLVSELREHDENKIEACHADIDVLLVWTGLFSAVVTAFTIESYKTLQQDPETHSTRLLEQLVLHFNGTAGLKAAGSPIDVDPEPSLWNVAANILWFSCLFLTLSTASLGVFVKQWLRYYLDWHCSMPIEQIQVRHFRYGGLQRWRVFEIAAILPLLLQNALLIFLLGLILFLRTINNTVWLFMAASTLLWISALVVFLVAPFFSDDCPYHTTIFQHATGIFRGIIAQMIYGRKWRDHYQYKSRYYRYPGDERGIRREPGLRLDALIGADESLLDNAVLYETLLPCSRSFGMRRTLRFSRAVLSHRLDNDIKSLHDVSIHDFDRIPSKALDALLDLFHGKLSQLSFKDIEPVDVSTRYQATIEMAFGMCEIVGSTFPRQESMQGSVWQKALATMRSEKLHMWFLGPEAILDAVSRQERDLLMERSADSFVRILMDAPADLYIQARRFEQRTISRIKLLIDRATKHIEKVEDDPTQMTSLARAILVYIQEAGQNGLEYLQPLDACLSIFCSAMYDALSKHDIKNNHVTYHNMKQTLEAIHRLNETSSNILMFEQLQAYLLEHVNKRTGTSAVHASGELLKSTAPRKVDARTVRIAEPSTMTVHYTTKPSATAVPHRTALDVDVAVKASTGGLPHGVDPASLNVGIAVEASTSRGPNKYSANPTSAPSQPLDSIASNLRISNYQTIQNIPTPLYSRY